jgi:predicted ATP-grasp superfamily ATP-dependent carboligase
VTRSGINLPLIWYKDVIGQPVQPQTEFIEGIKWIHEERDLKTVMLYFLPEQKLTPWTWFRSYQGKRVYAYAAWDDPKPILSSLARIVKAGYKRIKRKFTTKDPERIRNQGRKPKELEDLLHATDPTVGYGLRRISVD